ncbi:MAG TPA: RidA family protein [Candidatus Acidoferrales bacterium]|nr:RidA family protein [Candidatus Acidoferrales bacterium]
MKEIIATEKAPKAIGAYSQAVRANGFIFVSGQIPIDPATGELLVGDIGQQTARVMENLKAILDTAGSSLDRAVKVSVFLRDMSEFGGMNTVYAKYFPNDPPARATVQVARLPRDVGVEIDLIALA